MHEFNNELISSIHEVFISLVLEIIWVFYDSLHVRREFFIDDVHTRVV